MSDGKEQDVVRRYHLLFMTAALLAATLEVALPNLRVEFRDLEGESLQEETIAPAQLGGATFRTLSSQAR